MTLRRKMGLQIMAMIVGLLIVSATALWGIDALHEDYGLAAAGNQELRQIFEVGSHLATARILLLLEHADRARATVEVETAAARFDLFISGKKLSNKAIPDAAENGVKKGLADAVRQLHTPPEEQLNIDVLAADSSAVSAAIAKISALTSTIRESIEAHQRSAQHKRDVTMRAVGIVSAAVVLAAVLIGIMQYRGVMLPLNLLSSGVRKIAAGKFTERLALRGGGEFVDLAGEFNRMAGELDGFYHQLEAQVASKSKELIRSERLASLGYLAAGVAHEINNPLGIISGYAEYSLEQLRGRPESGDGSISSTENVSEDIAKSLQIICDEAFRCKDITGKLLSMARQGDENRATVCLADVADQVVSIIGGLRQYRDRTLTVLAPPTAAERTELTVSAVEAEMKQVLLNLTLNALEASPAGNGKVQIEIRAGEQAVEMSVSDNGRGMSPETVERVFEPFFTDKRGSPDARGVRAFGTGLGLSITHAIVEAHGGTIRAESDGVGKGSRFVVSFAKAGKSA